MTARRTALMAATTLVGLSAGFFYTYQISVTRALAQVDDTTYVTTFQAVNDTVRNPWFALVFFGSIPVAAIAVAVNWNARPAVRNLTALGLGLHLAVVAVTAAGNVPLNDELAAHTQPLDVEDAAEARQGFEDDWNRFNLLRAVAATASLLALVAATALSSGPTPRRPAPAPSPSPEVVTA